MLLKLVQHNYSNCRSLVFNKICKQTTAHRYKSDKIQDDANESDENSSMDQRTHFYPNTAFGIKERSVKPQTQPDKPLLTPFPPFPDGKNPKTGEIGGPSGPEPTIYGDWQRKGRVTDF